MIARKRVERRLIDIEKIKKVTITEEHYGFVITVDCAHDIDGDLIFRR